jgi:glycosyltransferase involved in cell wall biosynthesis
VAVSTTARDVVVANRLANADDVEIIPNPISGEAVLATERSSRGGRIRIGFLGAATPAKGFDLLPEVMVLTADLPITWHLYVTRNRSDFEIPVWQSIDSLGIELVERGRVHDVRDAYAECDVVFNPSRHESFSRVTAEALMNGIPVIGSDILPIRELLGVSGAGILFAPGDPRGAAEAVRLLVGDRELLERERSFARSAGHTFEPSAIAERMLIVYQAGNPHRWP